MAQWLKHWACNHKNLGSNPGHHCALGGANREALVKVLGEVELKTQCRPTSLHFGHKKRKLSTEIPRTRP